MRAAILVLFSLILSNSAYSQQETPPADHIMAGSQIEDFKLQQLGIATTAPARPITPLAMDLIKDFEGWSAIPYNDPVGYCTVGYGHLLSLNRCEKIDLKKVENGRFAQPISTEKGLEILEEDTRSARRAVQQLVKVDTTDDQFSALSSFVFNVNKENFSKSHLLIFVNQRNYKLAEREFPRWIKAKGEVLQGLIDRRKCEVNLFRGELRYNPKGKFDRKSCASLGIASGLTAVDIRKGE
ncbi:lysozyme [Labrys sp. ZIDIC5]|uniref:lysozyme n=1 Tax=Labrys sedimenti TaxID=3106036 RepID=UPI002ACA2962|nr:lysozyme [Labrys sp. ZIDIC5]MDZ5448623.1 lysozyme [Labrys sp. ZIDIC5]